MTDDIKQRQALAGKWIDALKKAGKKQRENWETKAEKVVDIYRDERDDWENEKRLNFLWSNVETLKPALYAKLPKPQVSRRFRDDDPVARQACLVLERALEFHLDAYDFDGTIRAAVEDYLLPGRGVVRVVYKPYFGDEKTPELDLIPEEDEEGEKRYKTPEGKLYDGEVKDGPNGPIGFGEPYQPVDYEEAECKYIYWKDYRHGPGRMRSEVPWEAFRSYYSRKQLVERFGNIGHKVPLDKKPETDNEDSDIQNMAEVWEIWDKESKKVYWICTAYSEPLDIEDAPVNYKDFFSTPKPLTSFTTNGSLTPIPEYCFYQDQAEELNELTERISLLVKALKVAGIYAGNMGEIARLLNEETENTLIPVDEWAMIAEMGGIERAISWYPVDQVMKVVVSLYEARERTKQELYEITGLSDIMRGASDSRETATAQRIKGQFGSLRLSDRQKSLQVFIRDVLRLKAEVICEHFSPQTLQMMTGVQMEPEMWLQVMQLLRNDPMRRFRIDIETDSTIEVDEQREKESAVEFMGMTSRFLNEMFPVAQAEPAILPLVSQMMMFTARRFRAGRQLEETMEQFLDQMEQKAQQPKPQQPPPEVIKAQAEIQRKQQEMQLKQQEMMAELQMKAREKQQDMALDAAKEKQDMALEEQEHQQDMQHDRQKHMLDMEQKAEQARVREQERQRRGQF